MHSRWKTKQKKQTKQQKNKTKTLFTRLTAIPTSVLQSIIVITSAVAAVDPIVDVPIV